MFKSEDSDAFLNTDLPENSIDVAVKNGYKSHGNVNGKHVKSAINPPKKYSKNIQYFNRTNNLDVEP